MPELLAVSLSAYVPQCIKEPTYLLAARAALQAVSGGRTEIVRVKKGVAQFGIMKGAPAGCKVTLWGDQAHEFMDKMVHLVFPRIKEWKGIRSTTGDESGNLGWGFKPEEFALFPEIELNYDAYPPKVSPLPFFSSLEIIVLHASGLMLTLCLLMFRWFLEFGLWFKLLPSRIDTPVYLCRRWVYRFTRLLSMNSRGTRCIILLGNLSHIIEKAGLCGLRGKCVVDKKTSYWFSRDLESSVSCDSSQAAQLIVIPSTPSTPPMQFSASFPRCFAGILYCFHAVCRPSACHMNSAGPW